MNVIARSMALASLALCLYARPAVAAVTLPLQTEPWSTPYVTTTLVYNALSGLGAALEGYPHPRWRLGFEVTKNRFGVNLVARLHFVPELRRGLRHHQFRLGLGGDFGVTPSFAAGGSATWLAPTVDLRYLGRPHPAFGFVLGTRLGIGFSWEARDLGPWRQPTTALDHLALVLVLYGGFAFGRHQ